ncbi:MAG TPA: glycoside hydrolase family 3 N-terminal domain-containing protein, partial [Acidimicrobiales bacterium]|nr:glycoside hydrolase family 3 N-terminal domain-containing protein [Acidimicrobiales bacterium]
MATPFETAAHQVVSGADAQAVAFGLVSEMTLEEKLGCLDGDTEFWPGLADMVSGGYHSHPWPAAKVPRLGIPGIDFVDGPRGSVVGAATCFPVSMARGATFDPSLEERVGEAIGKEMRAIGATYTGAVCMNLLRHPGWGRAQETYGEDPFHVGEMAAALTRGLQKHVMACMKHFALNSIEEARFRVDVTVEDRAMHEVYLPHFRRVANEGVASVMTAYNSVNGTWCGENEYLLTQVLRGEWGWDGFVTSDFIAGLHDPIASVKAGLDIEMPFEQQRHLVLPMALESGELDIDEVDQRVRDIVATLLRFAYVFESQPEPSVLACSEHRALAREVSARSMVLLRNDGNLLPVEPGLTRRVAVLGRLASISNTGDGGSSAVLPPDVVTVLDGIRNAFPRATVTHSDRDISISDEVDLAVVVVGFTSADEGEFIDLSAQESMLALFPPPPSKAIAFAPATSDLAQTSQSDDPMSIEISGEPPRSIAGGSTRSDVSDPGFSPGGDRRSLHLHAEDVELIRDVVATCPSTVVVVMGGSAVIMPWLEEAPAVIIGWYPGMEGGNALGDVLSGLREPSGRLPFAIPRDEINLV